MTEDVLVRVRTHPKVLVIPVLGALALLALPIGISKLMHTNGVLANLYSEATHGYPLLAALVVWAMLAGWFVGLPWLRHRGGIYTITTRRVTATEGVLYKNTREIGLAQITQIIVERGILDRIFRCGTIVIFDAANANGVRFCDVPNVAQVRHVLDKARSEVLAIQAETARTYPN